MINHFIPFVCYHFSYIGLEWASGFGIILIVPPPPALWGPDVLSCLCTGCWGSLELPTSAWFSCYVFPLWWNSSTFKYKLLLLLRLSFALSSPLCFILMWPFFTWHKHQGFPCFDAWLHFHLYGTGNNLKKKKKNLWQIGRFIFFLILIWCSRSLYCI